MKNLNQKLEQAAAAFNMYKFDAMPTKYRGNEFAHRDIPDQDDIDLMDAVERLDGFAIAPFYEGKQYDDHGKPAYYTERYFEILMMREGSSLLYKVRIDRARMITLHVAHCQLRQFNDLDQYKRRDATKNIPEPNRFGLKSLTAKKLMNWITYCDAQYNALSELSNQIDSYNADANDYVKTITSALNVTPKIIDRKGDKYVTTILEKSKFRIEFTLNKESGCLATEIKYEGDVNDILKLLRK